MNHLALKSPARLALQRLLWRRFFFRGVDLICKIIRLLLAFRTSEFRANSKWGRKFVEFPAKNSNHGIFFVCVSTSFTLSYIPSKIEHSVWSIKFEPYINCLCDFIMTFLANPHFILQISHAKTFKMKYIRCPYNNSIQKYS